VNSLLVIVLHATFNTVKTKMIKDDCVYKDENEKYLGLSFYILFCNIV